MTTPSIQLEILDDVTTALGIDDQDHLPMIELYIKLACKLVALYTGEDYNNLPDALTGIITEMALAKFAKRGNEGKIQAGEEGLTDQWSDDDLAPYMSQLNAYRDNKAQSGRKGWVMSLD
ncbi:phage head-tail connector protein [Limosilactobacillus vaginalis]|uniref:phage head-tail connector protein n=1 Tax=Limosilactobacillus vaginalis TaxID=1633 RepID=UPI00241D1A9E|nr:phage head-tail connector protein [Limosilactobacillus vaginalis]